MARRSAVMQIIDEVKTVLNTVPRAVFQPDEILALFIRYWDVAIPWYLYGYGNLQEFLTYGDPAAFSSHGDLIEYKRESDDCVHSSVFQDNMLETEPCKYQPLKDPPFSTAFKHLPLKTCSDSVGIIVSHFLDPRNFFITTVEEDEDRKRLTDELSGQYASEEESVEPHVYEGMPAVTTYTGNDDFHRIVVRTTNETAGAFTATVYYVDFGTEVPDVRVDDIRPISKRFLEMPVFTHRCRLDRVPPLNSTYSDIHLDRMGTIVNESGVLSAKLISYSRSEARHIVNIDSLYKTFVEEGVVQEAPADQTSNCGFDTEEQMPTTSNLQKRKWVTVRTLPNGCRIYLIKTRRGIFVPTACMAAILNMSKDLVLNESEKVKKFPPEIMELEEGNTTDEEIRGELKDLNCPLISDHSGRLYRTIYLIPAEYVPHLLKELPGNFPDQNTVCENVQLFVAELKCS